MVEQSVPVSAEEGGPGNDFLQLGFLKPDGSMHYSVIPKVAFRCRAVEYGWQLTQDFNEVVTQVLHELQFTQECNADADCDPAWEAGYHTNIQDLGEVSERLYTAETIQDARDAQVIRVEWIQENKIWLPVPGGNLHNTLWATRTVEHPVLPGLAAAVAQERRIVRKREDGLPKGQRPTLAKEGKK